MKRRLYAAVTAVLFLSSGLCTAAEGQPKHVLTLSDLIKLEWSTLYYMRISPDARKIVYTLWGKAAGGGDPDDDLWLVDAKSGGMPRQFGYGTVPQWSPDSKHIAYFAKDSVGDRQLWVLDVQTGKDRQVTHLKGGIVADPYVRQGGWIHDPLQFSWSPDGTRLVFSSQADKPGATASESAQSAAGPQSAPKAGTPLILTNTTPLEWTMHGVYATKDRFEPKADKPRPPQTNQLFVVDINSQQTEQLTLDAGDYFNPDWSPDGKKIACISTDGHAESGTDFENSQLYTIDVASGAKTAVTSGAGTRRVPQWSPDGRWIAYIGGQQRLGAKHPFVIAATGGAPVDLSRKLPAPNSPGDSIFIFHMSWTADSKSVIVSYNGVSRIDIASGEAKVLVPAKEVHMGLMTDSVARDGTLAWEESGQTSQGRVYILPKGAGRPVLVVETNPQMKDWLLGEQELFHWKNGRGESLEGVLIKPAGYREGQKYPLIVDCYPDYGKNPNAFYGSPMMGNQAFASQGYAVFFPAYRAPHVWMNVVRSEAFMDEAKGPEGWATTVDDIMSGVDELIRQGIVDPERLGASGFSNGGGIVDYLVTSTPRFKAAVSAAPVLPDWLFAFFFPGPGGSPSMVNEFTGFKKTPWDDTQAWVKMSAVFRLPKVQTPMLLAVGDNDLEFMPGIIEMYNGLRFLDKPVTLLRYPGQGHGFNGPSMEDFWARKVAFYDKYLHPKAATR